MFTLAQIAAAHARVTSGADFPAYIEDLKQLGVISYETFVEDGHTVYKGPRAYTVASAPKYVPLQISGKSDISDLKKSLKAHQQGGTDYPTFCRQAADAGVRKWGVSLEGMTCAYYDTADKEMLVERIPG